MTKKSSGAAATATGRKSSGASSTRGGVEDTRLEAKAKDTKKSEAKNSLSEDRHSRGQGQECSRPRTKDTSASALKKKKKRSSQKFFKRSPQKNVFQKSFQALHKILTIQKILLSSSRGQGNFRGLEAKAKDLTFEAKAKDIKMCPRGRPRGQGRPRGLHL